MTSNQSEPIVFATAVWSPETLENAGVLAASLREFGGHFSHAPFWLYVPAGTTSKQTEIWQRLSDLEVTIKEYSIPEVAQSFFSPLVFASSAAEQAARNQAELLAFLGNDAVILQEPTEFNLPKDKTYGYRPVMHRNICPLFEDGPDPFWNRVYDLLEVDRSKLFPVITPADDEKILPYINAGCMIVRPEHGLLAQWEKDFLKVGVDSTVLSACEQDQRKWIFTFQAALSGTVVNNTTSSQRLELSAKYNYPIFFKETYGAKHDFHNITDVAVIRIEGAFEKGIENWDKILQGPADRIAWLKKYAARE